jgi:ABC-type branched-subunit amino acid transport system substrate-binding protein
MRSRILAAGAVIALLTVACGNAGSDKTSSTTLPAQKGPATTASAADLQKNVPVDAPGVTDSEIQVAAITSKTNNLTGSYAPLVDGVKAYFEMVNDNGGIYGRKLVVSSDRDDQFTQNRQTVQASLSQDHAFATFIATTFFTGAELLAKANQPVFMWNINAEFAGHPTFFANDAALCFTCAGHVGPWLAKQVKATKIGLLAYGGAPQSADCATGVKASFAKYGGDAKIVFDDESISFAQPLGPQVTKMKQRGVQFVFTCVDLQESFTLAKEMLKQGMDASQQLPNGYNQDFISKNPQLNGAYVIPQFLAFEQTPQIDEIKNLFKYADKIGVGVSELTAVGWQIASELYTGLRGAGPEFSQAKVVQYLNTLTNYTDNGFLQPLNWRTGHIDPQKHPEARAPEECANFVKVDNGKFVPQFGQPGKPWVCFGRDDPTIDNPTYKTFVGT